MFGYPGKGAATVARNMGRVIAWQPTDLIVMAGVNDLAAGRRVNQVQASLAAVYRTARASGIRVVAVPVLPWGAYLDKSRFNRRRAAIVDDMRQLNAWIRRQGVKVVDGASSVSADGYRLRAELTRDGLHPNAAGQQRLGRQLARAAF